MGEAVSHYDYETSKQIAIRDWPFYALIMAAMRQADSVNLVFLKRAWPLVWSELQARYQAPGGLLEHERVLVEEECLNCHGTRHGSCCSGPDADTDVDKEQMTHWACQICKEAL